MIQLTISLCNLILIIMLVFKMTKIENENVKLRKIKRSVIDYIRSAQDENLSDSEILEKYLGVK